MLVSHMLLASAWIIYCLLHSLLASITIKIRLEKILKSNFRYYRICYTVFAFLGLAALMFFQFNISSRLLFSSGFAIRMIGIILMVTGGAIMLMMIRKYFAQTSGVRWLTREKVRTNLEVKGLHRFVRHPLYLGTFAFIWGWFLISALISSFIACAIITIYTIIGLKFEEQKLIHEFGDDYIQYKKKVPGLFPRF